MLQSSKLAVGSDGAGEGFHGVVAFIWAGLGTVRDSPEVAGVS
jgi:hypothetical protein